jgi:aspartyl-tRNA(Asn)/glutamyl-tRNA(Gln) amidotransferase subunit B
LRDFGAVDDEAGRCEVGGIVTTHPCSSVFIRGSCSSKMNWEIVIGLETHAQLTTASKIFSGASTAFGAAPNTQASAVDLALPGTLPVLNRGAVERAIRFGLAVGGSIAARSIFARKNYFYPDLPKGYQISQYEEPVVSGGSLAVVVGDTEKRVRLTRAHLEEDAGKSLHEDFHGMSGIDLNRAGTPLLEIVSEPDMRSAAEAVAYAKALHALVRWIGVCDGNMQEGSFRCDANVSVRRPGAPLGTRCEIKNLNSFRFLEKAIEYEARRQVELLEDGGKVLQETRLFDPDRGETRPMRSKEEAEDYRYFPDPDLLPLEIAASWIDEVRASLPALPEELRRRYRESLAISEYEAALLTESREKALYFEAALAAVPGLAARLAANWVNGEMSALINDRGGDFAAPPVAPQPFARLLARIEDGTVSAKAAKAVLLAMADGEGEPDAIIAARGLRQISDAGALEAAVAQVLAANAKLVEDYRSGKEKAFNALVGQVMKATQGKANPAQAGEILRRKLAA